ncbi:MAG TPA: YceI family protein [Acidimicrobiia bacterium]|nr:YceI family protein [Acidimicrobiia bacterium]
MAPADKPRKWLRRAVVGAVAVLVVVVGGPFVYIHFIEGPAPKPLSLDTTPTTVLNPGETRARLAGTWKITSPSVVRYRVKETLFGQSNTAVGKTNAVTGSMTIAGTTVTTASFTVDLTTVTSGRATRDAQFQGRIMDTADFPDATFALTKPISLGTEPKNGVQVRYTATGKLTLHGTTKDITFPLNARRTANVIAVQGSVPVVFSDYGIDNPSGGPASVGNAGQMEFVLELEPA